MAEHEREASDHFDHSPRGTDHRRTHPGSPGPSECSSGYTGPVSENGFSTSGNSEHLENGYINGHVSEGDSNEAPLDFSIKKVKSEEYSENVKGGNNRRVDGVRTQGHHEYIARADRGEFNGVPCTPDGSPRHAECGERIQIGEPRPAPEGVLPGTTIPGLIPGLPAGVMATPAMLGMAGLPFLPPGVNPRGGNHDTVKSGTRPFKAYPKDPLAMPLGYYNFSGMLPFPNMDAVTAQSMGLSPEEMFHQYRDYIIKLQEHMGKENHKNGKVPISVKEESSSPRLPDSTDSTCSSVSTSPTTSVKNSPIFSGVPPYADNGTTNGNSNRKRPKHLPEDLKDVAYWDRRRKNNAAAKRSRDSRRAKEDEIAIRAAFLEQENLKLRVEVAALKNETAKLRCMLYNS